MAPNKEVFQAIVTDDKLYEFSSQYKNICDDVFAYAMSAETQQMETTAGTLFGRVFAFVAHAEASILAGDFIGQ